MSPRLAALGFAATPEFWTPQKTPTQAGRIVRSLFVSMPSSPLPLGSGWAIRSWNQLVALRSLGEVDVWLFDEPDGWRAELLSRELGDQRVHADTSPRKEW